MIVFKTKNNKESSFKCRCKIVNFLQCLKFSIVVVINELELKYNFNKKVNKSVENIFTLAGIKMEQLEQEKENSLIAYL